MALGVPQPSWLPTPRRVFGQHAPHHATLEYSDSNEDLANSLRWLDVEHGNVVVGVTGSADLLLLTLRHDPAFVVGYDVNPAQNAVAELKRGAIATLSYGDFLALLGYEPSPKRRTLLSSVLESLPDDVRTFWQREDSIDAVDRDLWRQGSATRRDLEQWSSALEQLEARVGPHDLRVVLGLEGTDEQRASLRARIARTDPKYAEPAIRNNNHFKFDAFRYPIGMVNHPAVSRYAAPFLQIERVTPPISEEDFHHIRPRLHRIAFQTLSFHDALEQMPPEAFDRAYLSNITEYLTLHQEQQLVDALLSRSKTDAIAVLLYVALSPAQQRDLLDHSTWSERGVARFLRASQWEARLEQVRLGAEPQSRFEEWAREAGRTMGQLSRGGAKQALSRTRERIRSLDEQDLSNQAAQHARRAVQRFRDFDYARAGRSVLESTRSAVQQAQDRWAEVRQLSEHDFVLIENQSRTAAFYSDIYENLRATHASRSFYGFDHAVLHKVVRHGPTYRIPTPP